MQIFKCRPARQLRCCCSTAPACYIVYIKFAFDSYQQMTWFSFIPFEWARGSSRGKERGVREINCPSHTSWVYPVHVCDIFCTYSTDIKNNKTVVKHCYYVVMNVYRLFSCLFLPRTARVSIEIGNWAMFEHCLNRDRWRSINKSAAWIQQMALHHTCKGEKISMSTQVCKCRLYPFRYETKVGC